MILKPRTPRRFVSLQNISCISSIICCKSPRYESTAKFSEDKNYGLQTGQANSVGPTVGTFVSSSPCQDCSILRNPSLQNSGPKRELSGSPWTFQSLMG